MHESILTDTKPCAVKVSVAEGTQVMAKTTGSLAANFPMCDGGTVEGAFGMALHTPSFDLSLLSAIRIVKNGGSVHLEKGDCYFCPTDDRSLKIRVDIDGDDFVVPVTALPAIACNVDASPSTNGGGAGQHTDSGMDIGEESDGNDAEQGASDSDNE